MKASRWIMIAVAVALLIGLFVLLRPGSDAPAPTPAASGGAATGTAAATDITLTLKGTNVSGVGDTVPVALNAPVHLSVTSDEAGEVHLHGYELMADAEPGTPATIDFTADAPGRYELEFHPAVGDEFLITEIEVS